MERKTGSLQTAAQGEEGQSAMSRTSDLLLGQEYFERYEKRRTDQESQDRGSLDYWLSEGEQEESHQLKRQSRSSRLRKVPYVVQNAKSPKLRPAEDVIKRLRWDPRFEVVNFTIGYVERFEGVKEMPMREWISETSDEDFIPQHRIRYFKRDSDGEVVWDRETRIDKIFGSGSTGELADQTGGCEDSIAEISDQSQRAGY